MGRITIKLLLTLAFCFICLTSWADTVTYYFNAYDSGGEEWATNPANMVDNDTETYARTTNSNVELLTGNTCLGTDLGTITKVEIRFYSVESYGDLVIRPVFGGSSDGDNHNTFLNQENPLWSDYINITSDTNAPSPWIWSDVQNLDCDVFLDVEHFTSVAKVEIRVTYIPTATYYFNAYDSGGEEWITNPAYMVDNNLANFAHETTQNTVQLLTANTNDGTDLGRIIKVEVRAYHYGEDFEGLQGTIKLRPVFTGGDGDDHALVHNGTAAWSSYIDITSDTNAPYWIWTAVQNLDCDVVHITSGSLWAKCAKVEIRVTYTTIARRITIQ